MLTTQLEALIESKLQQTRSPKVKNHKIFNHWKLETMVSSRN